VIGLKPGLLQCSRAQHRPR